MPTPELLAIWTPSFPELVIVLIIALLLFGKRLPEVARSLGKGVVEFKKGIKGIEEEVQEAEHSQYEPPEKLYSEEKAPTDSSSPTGGETPKS